ncbi:hypothetical protein LCGC14_1333350 [marine sediment metagenome]|uniref:Uncharacterized protein n=1 Tax=marine sediment metagenome TaxID=412755 RepID=A0A0F9L1X8_9ZZZZ
MKVYNKAQYQANFLDKKINEIGYFSYNFNKIPPIIGVITADQFGNTLMVFEYDDKNEGNYGPIKSYLSESDKNLLEIDLISMYFSSFKTFAGQTNIQNLSNLEIHGSNIKVQIHFLFDRYMIILFLNSKIDLNLREKTQIIHYFEDNLLKYKFEFKHFNASNSRKIIKKQEEKGKVWLKKLNKTYIQTFQNAFSKKHEILDLIMDQIAPIIKTELGEFLEGVPEFIIEDVSKELRNKIHDKICEFNLNLD